jgi:hypothetical protein
VKVGDTNGSDEVANTTPPVGPASPGEGCNSAPGAKGDAEALAEKAEYKQKAIART